MVFTFSLTATLYHIVKRFLSPHFKFLLKDILTGRKKKEVLKPPKRKARIILIIHLLVFLKFLPLCKLLRRLALYLQGN